VEAHVPSRDAVIGVLGCGLSALPEALARAGYTAVDAVDASEVAIQARHSARARARARHARADAHAPR
jgi:2-polyprenyl-3-methyl-5-hydroxy-6-metoxy-1,4-benzoquinol methylase